MNQLFVFTTNCIVFCLLHTQFVELYLVKFSKTFLVHFTFFPKQEVFWRRLSSTKLSKSFATYQNLSLTIDLKLEVIWNSRFVLRIYLVSYDISSLTKSHEKSSLKTYYRRNHFVFRKKYNINFVWNLACPVTISNNDVVGLLLTIQHTFWVLAQPNLTIFLT